jgi:hypothetical protein
LDSASIFPSEDGLQEVRLDGPLNTYEFWKQPEVLKELKSLLTEKLATPAFFPSFLTDNLDTTPAVDWSYPSAAKPSRSFSFFRKKEGSSSNGPAAKQEAVIEVAVDLEEICLRTESDFGLYETITRPAVVIRVNALC